jgi:hypothetical protein
MINSSFRLQLIRSNMRKASGKSMPNMGDMGTTAIPTPYNSQEHTQAFDTIAA